MRIPKAHIGCKWDAEEPTLDQNGIGSRKKCQTNIVMSGVWKSINAFIISHIFRRHPKVSSTPATLSRLCEPSRRSEW